MISFPHIIPGKMFIIDSMKHLPIFWLLLSIGIWTLVFAFIPPCILKKIWLPSLIAGFLMTFLINYLAVIYRVWSFPPGEPVVFKTPLLLAFAWYGSMMIFNYFLLIYSRFRLYIIAFFTILSAGIFYSAKSHHHLIIHHLSIMEVMFLALFTHSFSLILMRLFTRGEGFKPDDNPLGTE